MGQTVPNGTNCVSSSKARKELIEMDGKYTFERMNNELDNGYIIFYTYVRNRYQLFKTAENCYTQQLLTENLKNPLPRLSIITHKRLKEIFPYMEDIEYKVANDLNTK